ncbi:MAG: hypothetical protein AB7N24_22435 [Dehalococcoidia bacterium]
MKFFAQQAPHGPGSQAAYNWRGGCVRRTGPFGFSAFYYEATPEFQERTKGEAFAEFARKEWRRSNGGRRTRFFDTGRDPFVLLDEPEHVLEHQYFLFEHSPQGGFVTRLCDLLKSADMRVVQYDAIIEPGAVDMEHAVVYHAVRCYRRAGSGATANTVTEAIVEASDGTWSGRVQFGPPSPRIGIVSGALPHDQTRAQRFGYFAVCVETQASGANPTRSVSADEALEAWLPATELLAACAESIEGAAGTRRSILRCSMRTLGVYTAVILCAPLRGNEESELLRRVISNRLGERKYIMTPQCKPSPEAPWACPDGRVKTCLPKLKHRDRRGYLADYYDHVGEELTERVSVTQYDSYVPREKEARHQLSICVTDPSVATEDGKRLIEEWVVRHQRWLRDQAESVSKVQVV